MEWKLFTVCNIEKYINIFIKNIQNIKIVIAQEDWNVTMVIKIKLPYSKK